MKFKAKMLTPFNTYVETPYLYFTVPPIASGKKYCGPCQLNDKAKCLQFNEICWKEWQDYKISAPTLSKDCLKNMAPICYEIWNTTSINNDQCLDFKTLYDFDKMKIKPKLLESRYAMSGKYIMLKFDQPILHNPWGDCSQIFNEDTLKWFPESKSCKWSSPTELDVEYDPEIGILEEMVVNGKLFYYDYDYAQFAADEIKLPVLLPTFDAVLKVTGLTSVSECDNVNLFGTLVSPTLYELNSKWNLTYIPPLTGSLLEEANTLLAPFSQFAERSSISIPNKLLKHGTKIYVTLIAKSAKFISKEINATTIVNVLDSAPRIMFTQKSQFVIELDGSKVSTLPLLIENKYCNPLDKSISSGSSTIKITFNVSIGDDMNSATLQTSDELAIIKTLEEIYKKQNALLVGSRYGFKYLRFYNLTAIINDTQTGKSTSDTIIIYFIKPPLKAIIDIPGSLVSTQVRLQLNGSRSEFPALENDVKYYLWKCVSAKILEKGMTCDCPLLPEENLKSENLVILREKLVPLCKYKFSLSLKATAGLYTRTALNETEFVTFDGPTSEIKGKLVQGTSQAMNDIYLTFGTEASQKSSTYKWTMTDVESLDPRIKEKYTVRNTFIYDFFTNEYKSNIDPEIKKGDSNTTDIKTRRRLADIQPTYLTPNVTRTLGMEKSDLQPLYKYTFAVTVYSNDQKPSFLFITFTNPPAPRTRSFSVSPNRGIAFSTQFAFTFTRPISTETDIAQYQLFRKNCPGSNNTMSSISQKFGNSNIYTTILGPGLKICNFQVEVILRIYESNSFVDTTLYLTVLEPGGSAEESLMQQALYLEYNSDLTMNQKLSIISEVTNVPVTEVSEQAKITLKSLMGQIYKIDQTDGILAYLDEKDQTALLNTTTATLSNLVENQKTLIDSAQASSITSKIGDFLNLAGSKSSGTLLIPSALSALNGIADIAKSEKTDSNMYTQIQEPISKMSDMKMAEIVPGSVPYSISSNSIEMTIAKGYSEDYNKNITLQTTKGTNIVLPEGIADLMKAALNTTANNTLSFGASVYATSYNPFINIKNNTNISMESLSGASMQGFKNTTVYRIYEDLGSQKLNDVVDKKEQDLDIIKVEFKPYQVNEDASETKINSQVSVGDLPPGKDTVFSLPLKYNVSEFINKTVMIPLYYIPEEKRWTNENCSLDQPLLNVKSLIMRCRHMGKKVAKEKVDEGMVVTVDVIKDVFRVIKAGNYEQLANFSALTEFNTRTIVAISFFIILSVFSIAVVVALMKMDRSELFSTRLECLFKKMNPKIKEKNTLNLFQKVLKFFKNLKNKGSAHIAKTSQGTVTHKKEPSGVMLSSNNLRKKAKRSNGYHTLSKSDLAELTEIYLLYQQCLVLYDESEISEILQSEFEKSNVLNRLTQMHIDNLPISEGSSLWLLIKTEHQMLNAILMPEIITPRPLKFLIFMCVLIGELFVTGFFYDPEETKPISENRSGFISSAIIFSIAANVLMIPLKIIISVFMTGKPATPEMTREEIENAEKSRPMFKTIGMILGFGWLFGCLYAIMMYIVSFTQISVDNWMTTFGISAFTELFIVTQLKVMLKVVIGILLMKLMRTKVMMSVAGVFAGKIIDWVLRII